MCRCQQQLSKSRAQLLTLGGEQLDRACRAVFAALLWHTQSLRDDVQRYVSEDGDCRLRDGVIQAYHTADSLRTLLVCTSTLLGCSRMMVVCTSSRLLCTSNLLICMSTLMLMSQKQICTSTLLVHVPQLEIRLASNSLTT